MTAALTNAIKVWHAPDVMDAFMLRGRFSNHRYPLHAHDSHCLAVITGGTVSVQAAGEQRVCRRGDMVVINADTVHAGHAPDAGQWKMRVAHVHPAALADYSEQLGLARRGNFALDSAFIRDSQLAQQLYGVNWCSETGNDALKRSEVLAAMVVGLHTRHSAEPIALPVVRSEAKLVRAVKDKLRDDLTAKHTLPALARQFGVTSFVLLRAFVKSAGLSPHAYQQQARVRRAVQLLRAGTAIAEVSAQTGFADQAHFTRVFKSQIGVTPRMFQGAVRSVR